MELARSNIMGTLYIFFGPSGVGKDFLQKGFISYSEKALSVGETDKIVKPVERIHSRKKRNYESPYIHKFDVPFANIAVPENFYAFVNGACVGINKERLKTTLASGTDLVFSTGSVDMIEKLINDPDIKNNICLIYLTGPGYDEKTYFALELQRNHMSSLQDIVFSGHERYENSLRVAEFYNNNKMLFDYAYINVTSKATRSAAEAYKSPFLDKFYQAIFYDTREDGPCWISNKAKDRNRN